MYINFSFMFTHFHSCFMFIHLPQFCLKRLQLLLQRSNRLNCLEQCPCGTCQRYQGQDDVHDTGTHWPKDRQQVAYPWRKISGHWQPAWHPFVNTGMNDHEISWMHRHALWTLISSVAISNRFRWRSRRREILQIRTPSKSKAFDVQNFPSCRTFRCPSEPLEPSTLQNFEKPRMSQAVQNFPNTGTLEPSRTLENLAHKHFEKTVENLPKANSKNLQRPLEHIPTSYLHHTYR